MPAVGPIRGGIPPIPGAPIEGRAPMLLVPMPAGAGGTGRPGAPKDGAGGVGRAPNGDGAGVVAAAGREPSVGGGPNEPERMFLPGAIDCRDTGGGGKGGRGRFG